MDEEEAELERARAQAAGELQPEGIVLQQDSILTLRRLPLSIFRSTHKRRSERRKKPFRRPLRGGKVQIVLWPCLKRFRLIGELSEWGAEDGERVSKLFKAQVVYHCGVMDDNDPGEIEERYPLAEHVRKVCRAHWLMRRTIMLVNLVFLILLLIYLISFFRPQDQGEVSARGGRLGYFWYV